MLGQSLVFGQATRDAAEGNAADSSAANSGDSAALGEVVVTAQRRVENQQKIGVAVTSVNSDQFNRLGGGNVAALQMVAPSVQVNNNGSSSALIGIRGIITANNTDVGDPAVAFENDGIYNSRAGTAGSTLFDVDHIEVLRGPQGTLYGRNATTGVINVITRKPTREFGSDGYVEFGNFSAVNAFGAVNLPLADGMAVRGAFITRNHDAMYDNGLGSQNYGDLHDTAGRITGLFTAIENLSVLLRVGYQTENDHGFPPSVNLPLSSNPFKYSLQYPGVENLKQWSGQAVIDYTLPFGTLTYDGGWHQVDEYKKYQVPGVQVLQYNDPQASRTWQHELRLAGDAGRFKYVGGLYYFREAQEWMVYVVPSVAFLMPDESQNSKAAYGQTTFSVTDALRLTAGARWTDDHKFRQGGNYAYTPPASLQNGQFAPLTLTTIDYGSIHSSKFNYRVGIEYDLLSQTMVYASLATGYKQGGFFDGDGRTFNNTYKPENVTSVESGFKSRFLDERLQVNLAAFGYEYTDFQVSFQNPQLVTQTYNAQVARNIGAELEFDSLLTRHDRLGGSATYLHARYSEFNIPGGPDIYGHASYSGNTLPFAPTWGINLDYAHTFDLPGDKIVTFSALSHWQSDVNLDFHGFAPTHQTKYSRSDLNLLWGDADGKYSVEAFVRNVENKLVLVSAGLKNNVSDPNAAGRGGLALPRTYGVRFSYKY
jgi:iron complex outermembrane receptor protein